jgi:hypothetical protein
MAEPEIIEVGPMDPNLKNSPIMDNPPPKETSGQRAVCIYNNIQYSPGARIVTPTGVLECMPSGYWRRV